MSEFIAQYWIQIGFTFIIFLFTTGYKFLNTKIRRAIIEQDATKNGIKALLKDRIIQAYSHSMEKGFCLIHELDHIVEMQKEYETLLIKNEVNNIPRLIHELGKLPKREK